MTYLVNHESGAGESSFVFSKELQFWCGLHFAKINVSFSVADPDPGSGAFLPPGSGIRIRDPGWSNGRIRIRDK
jgi:hypothetical protein